MGGKHPSPAMIAVGCDMFLQQDHRPLLPILRACMREDRYPRLAEIAVPTVVMVGSADRTTPPSHARRLAAGVPGRGQLRASPGGTCQTADNSACRHSACDAATDGLNFCPAFRAGCIN